MGNQESSLDGSKYIIKKKKNENLQNSSKNPNNNSQKIINNTIKNKNIATKEQIIPNTNNSKNNNNQQVQYIYHEYDNNIPVSSSISSSKNNMNSKNHNIQLNNTQFNKSKEEEKQIYNNSIIQRNIINDIYINQTTSKNKDNQNYMMYPSNSNNELTKPKANFDNLEFTPYNFNEEVNKFKENIDIEKIEFEKNEKIRREKFESTINNKTEYLRNQIQKFEENYNPWEILGMNNYDLDINNIKKSYKKMALKYHPDKVGEKYKDKFQLITQSYIYLLGKSEEENLLNNKINRKVSKIDYENDINEGIENIYVSKDKFDINQFNKIFEKYKVPDSFDNGYGDLMKEEIKEDKEKSYIFGSKFNNDIFNAHFDNKKNKKKSSDIIEYREPDALDSSFKNVSHQLLGMDSIEDFGSINSGNLSYTDYKKAHVDETLLIDVNKVKYKKYDSIDQLEADRSNLSYNVSPEDKQRYEYMERKRQEDDNFRLSQLKNYDKQIENQYNRLNQRLIIHK